MGLDMFLYAKQYLPDWSQAGQKLQADIAGLFPELAGTDIKPKRIELEVGYWRKANQIHGWFVDNVQEGKDECQPHYVDREKLEELRALCQSVIDNPSLAEKVLPARSGFFFGDTGYGEWYIEDLKWTVKVIDRALKLPEDWDFEYLSSW